LHGCIISLRGEIWAHKTSLTLPLFIEVPVPLEWTLMCLYFLWVLDLFIWFSYWNLRLFWRWYLGRWNVNILDVQVFTNCYVSHKLTTLKETSKKIFWTYKNIFTYTAFLNERHANFIFLYKHFSTFLWKFEYTDCKNLFVCKLQITDLFHKMISIDKLQIWGAVVVIWKLDLQLPMQSVPITTDMSSNPV
jgi:hypothetical protein